MLFSELKCKEVINLRDCRKLGHVTDFEFDQCTGCICKLIVPGGAKWKSFFSCDTDHVIAAAGVSKKEYLERRVTPALEDLMEGRRSFVAAKAGDHLQPVEGIERSAAVAYPIIASGDVTGAVVMMREEAGEAPTEAEIKLIQTAAAFLGRQLEE